jgi:hypothetical protein
VLRCSCLFLSVSIGFSYRVGSCDAGIASDSPRLSGLAAEISGARERRVHGVSTMNRGYSWFGCLLRLLRASEYDARPTGYGTPIHRTLMGLIY